jgi:hypothetical protein
MTKTVVPPPFAATPHRESAPAEAVSVESSQAGEEMPPRSWHGRLMCNLYSIKTRRADLARKFRLSDNRMAVFGTLPAIFPGGMAPIIRQSVDGERELVIRSWGFILLRDGYAPKRVTNTRVRQGAKQVLEGQLRQTALPCACDRVLRT